MASMRRVIVVALESAHLVLEDSNDPDEPKQVVDVGYPIKIVADPLHGKLDFN